MDTSSGAPGSAERVSSFLDGAFDELEVDDRDDVDLLEVIRGERGGGGGGGGAGPAGTRPAPPDRAQGPAPEVGGSSGSERDRWDSKLTFLLSAIGSAIGLGNIWRFPYQVYRFGGGAFLVPYFLSLAVVGLPLLYLELGLGQVTQAGGVGAMGAVHSRAWGVGLSSASAALLITIYYQGILAWIWQFIFQSFRSPVPWAGGLEAAETFFKRRITGACWPRSDTCRPLQSTGRLRGAPLACLALAWLLVWMCVCRGPRSIGRASTVVLPLPMLLLGVLLVRGATLPGAAAGIRFYLAPDWSLLGSVEIWINAMTQIFFSTSVASGVMIAFGSYNPRDHDVARSALVVGLSNSAASIFAGFVVFAMLGHLAHEEGVGVGAVAAGGTGLAFVVFPAVLATLPAAPLFSVVFFATLALLGLCSAFSLVEAFNVVLFDRFPLLARHKPGTAAAVCAVGLVCGLPLCTDQGEAWLDIFDHYVSDYVLVTVGLAEAVLVGWVYGAERLAGELEAATGRGPPRLWAPTVKFALPVLVALLFIYNVVREAQKPFGMYPRWALGIGWLWFVVAVVCMLAGPLHPRHRPPPPAEDACPEDSAGPGTLPKGAGAMSSVELAYMNAANEYGMTGTSEANRESG